MVLVPLNTWSLPMASLRDMLKNVAAYQTLTGSEDAAEAAATIFFVGESFANLPATYVLIDGPQWELDQVSGGSASSYRHSGVHGLTFFVATPEAYRSTEGAAILDFMNSVGAVIEGLGALSGTAGNLTFQKIMVSEPPEASVTGEKRDGSDTLVHYVAGKFELDWSQ